MQKRVTQSKRRKPGATRFKHSKLQPAFNAGLTLVHLQLVAIFSLLLSSAWCSFSLFLTYRIDSSCVAFFRLLYLVSGAALYWARPAHRSTGCTVSIVSDRIILASVTPSQGNGISSHVLSLSLSQAAGCS